MKFKGRKAPSLMSMHTKFELDLLSGSGATLFFACIVDSTLEILFKNFSFRGLVAGTITQIWAVEKT